MVTHAYSRLALGSCALFAGCAFDASTIVTASVDGSSPQADADVGVPDASTPQPSVRRFSTEAELWHVPTGPASEGFFALSGEGAHNWATLDINGDGFVDLLHTSDPNSAQPQVHGLGGAPHWRVYFGEASGFAENALSWPVPDSDAFLRGFFLTKRSAGASWSLADMNGDGLVDLVQTTDPAIGRCWEPDTNAHWRVFLNTGTGFDDQFLAWPVPAIGYGFIETANVDTKGAWSLADLDGNGSPDLVHSAPSRGLPLKVFDFDATPHWNVYINSGLGFALTPQNWQVPSDTWEHGYYAQEDLGWSTLDIDGDGVLELVQTSRRSPDDHVIIESGEPVWRVYESTQSGFSQAPTSIAVPTTTTVDGFYSVSADEPLAGWSTVDINGDGLVDLVHTTASEGTPNTVWGTEEAPEWRVHLGDGAGFALDAISWAVPQSGESGGFYSTNRSAGAQHWATLDLDGDGQVELVHTADPASGGAVWSDASGAHWMVYRAIE